jgi:hypothetical protein
MKKVLSVVLAFLILAGCGKKNNPQPQQNLTPAAALLSSPAQNQVCTTGNVISATESAVSFSWSASSNADSYQLTLKNLLTADSTTQNTTATTLTLTILRNTPYSWYITSKSTKTSSTGRSEVWKFYNSGPGVVTYAPYPAELTSPTLGQLVTAANGLIKLTWVGSAVTPGAIANYDVYFGTATSPSIYQSAITDNYVDDVSVVSGTTYYWKVITRDVGGNTSDSGVQQFTVK